jgi:hypothetical protein
MQIQHKRLIARWLRLAFDWAEERLHTWEVSLRPAPQPVIAPQPVSAPIPFDQWESKRRDVAPSRKTTARRRRMTARGF